MAAARFLHNRGEPVVVLEARDRIGGRISSLVLKDGLIFEEGASWIHGPEGNPLTDLAAGAGATYIVSDDDNTLIYDHCGALYPDHVVKAAENLLGELLENLGGKKKDSFATALYRRHPELKGDPLWDYLLSAYVEFDIGGDITELSGKDFYDDEDFGGQDLIVANGYHRLVDQLAEGLDVRLNQVVTAVRHTENGVEIETEKDIFSAERVVVAAPLGVLKAETISFEPPLPDYLEEAINGLGVGLVNKYCCRWADPFWDVEAQFVGFTSETKGQFNLFTNHLTYSEVPALTTYTYGHYAHEATKLTDDDIITLILANLRTIYGPEVPLPLAFYRTDWGGEDFTRGAYSFVPVGQRSKLYDAFRGGVGARLFFAGEHTSREYRATVHGAYLSGVRAALATQKVLSNRSS